MYLIGVFKTLSCLKMISESEIIATIGNFDGLHLGHQK